MHTGLVIIIGTLLKIIIKQDNECLMNYVFKKYFQKKRNTTIFSYTASSQLFMNSVNSRP